MTLVIQPPSGGKLTLAKEFTWNETVWNPSMITTALWLDAADASTITESGGAVSQWDDKSGNDRNFTGASGTWPSTGLATQNNKNVLSFDADFLTSADAADTWTFLHDNTGSSVFAVATFGVSSNPNAVYSLFGTNGTASAAVGMSFRYADVSPFSNSVRHQITRGIAGDFVVSADTDNVATPNEARIVSLLADPASSTTADRSIISIDAGSELKSNTSSGVASISNPSYTLSIGSAGNAVSPLVGQLAEMVIVLGIASTDTRQRIEGYLAHKWGLTTNLPSGHPYKLVGPTP